MRAQRKPGNAVERIGDDLAAHRKAPHVQRFNGHLAAHLDEARTDFMLRLGMQKQINIGRGGGGLTRMVIRRIANAAETEHDIATRQRATKCVGQALPVIAQVHRPIQMHAACGEDFQQAREMAIRALAMHDFVADDDGANRLPVAICILHKNLLND